MATDDVINPRTRAERESVVQSFADGVDCVTGRGQSVKIKSRGWMKIKEK